MGAVTVLENIPESPTDRRSDSITKEVGNKFYAASVEIISESGNICVKQFYVKWT